MNQIELAQNNDNKITFCTFWLAGRLCGVNILDVKEINMELRFTPIAHAPEEVIGYVNIRGQIYLVADMRQLMGFDKTESTKESRLIIFKDTVLESFAVLVDRIDDVVTVEKDEILDRRKGEKNQGEKKNEQRKDHYAIGGGVCKLEESIMVVINSSNLLKKIEHHFK